MTSTSMPWLVNGPLPQVREESNAATALELETLHTPKDAFDELGKTVWRFLRRLGVPPASLDDATQDVFVVVVRRWADFRGASTRKTWVLGITAKVAANYRRREKSHPRQPLCADADQRCAVTSAPAEHSLASSATDPYEATACRQASELVDRVLETLSHEERCLFVLVEMEGFLVPEVAPAFSLSRRRAHTILERVRRTFEAAIHQQNVVSVGSTPEARRT